MASCVLKNGVQPSNRPRTSAAPIRVLLASDCPLFLDTAARILAGLAGVEVMGAVRSGREALEQAAALHPDFVLVGLLLSDRFGVIATFQLKELPNPPHVIMVGGYGNPVYQDLARLAGADGFLSLSTFWKEIGPLLDSLRVQPDAITVNS